MPSKPAPKSTLRRKDQRGKKKSLDQDEIFRVVREARIAASAAAAAATAAVGPSSCGKYQEKAVRGGKYEHPHRISHNLPFDPGPQLANRQSLEQQRQKPRRIPDLSFDSAERAIERGSMLGVNEIPDPQSQRPKCRLGDVTRSYTDVDLFSVADTTLQTMVDESREGGGVIFRSAVMFEGAESLDLRRSKNVPQQHLIVEENGGQERALVEEKKSKERGVKSKKRGTVLVFPRTSILKTRLRKNRRIYDAFFSSDRSAPHPSSKFSRTSSGSWRRKKRKRVSSGPSTAKGGMSTVLTQAREAASDAWMCGLCGLAFSSVGHAESHELRCVWEAFGPSDGAGVGVTMTANRTEPGLVPLVGNLRRCVIMTDEAVRKVAGRASTLVLMPDETDAELELALLARDRAYYDLLARRSAYRHGGFTKRGRGGGLSRRVWYYQRSFHRGVQSY